MRHYYYIAEKPRYVELRRSALLYVPEFMVPSKRGSADRWLDGEWIELNTFLNHEDRRISPLELALLMPEVCP